MMNWAPLCCSKFSNFVSRIEASVGETTPAVSVNQRLGGGGTSSAKTDCARRRKRRRRRGRTECAPLETELDVRSLAAARSALEVSLRFESAHARHHARREAADGGVVRGGHLVEALALHGDAVLGSFELRLQLQEIPVRLQIGILLDDDEQSRKSAGETG